jgi:protein TonB
MTSFIHVLQITTLATWLSVGVFGGVGLFIHPGNPSTDAVSPALETTMIPEDFTLGDLSSPESGETSSASTKSAEAETLPAPPEMPDLVEFDPLPDIPSLPPAPTIRKSQPASRAAATPQTSRKTPARPASSGRTSSGGSSSGMSDSARLAAGRMSAPSYPPEARRKGQTGTVVVEFTVDSSGRVISAYAKQPSPWPLLNNEAVRTVRRWKFPPGGVMKLQRPIVFQLR